MRRPRFEKINTTGGNKPSEIEKRKEKKIK